MGGELTKELVAERFAAAQLVKSNPVREVRADGEYFYKLDRRRGHGFAREMAAARLLEERHIPVVGHLWCGAVPEGEMLVTRALAEAPTVREYIADRVPDEAFRRRFAKFIGDFLASDLDHDDLHIGNILYSRSEERFVLVDVRAVRSRRRRKFPYEICRAPMELRKHLRRDELRVMLEIAGVPDPERFYWRSLRIEAGRLNRDWPKRRAQILGGYPKFTREAGALLINADAAPADLERLVWHPGGESEFCSAFYWELAAVPHPRVLAFDREKLLIGTAPELFPTPLPDAEIAERRRILEDAL